MLYKLMTIDVWDTLLRRNCHYDSSKLASAYRLSLTHHRALKTDYQAHWDIYRERCDIEASIACARHTTTSDGEYTIDEVLTTLCQRVLQPGTDAKAVAATLVRYELEYEIAHTYADPTIINTLAQYKADQRYFLSDFYMSAKCIQQLLAHHRLDKFVDGGFSSCDSGYNKRLGNIYPYVHNTLGVTAKEHLHIGDNAQADVAMAQKHGIDAVHFMPDKEHAERLKKEDFLTDRPALFTHIASTVNTALSERTKVLPAQAQSAFLLGMQSAPLYAGFMLHIAEHAIIDNIPALFFFTREGEFFIQVWQHLFPDSVLHGVALPTASTLGVSRIATFCPSLREISTKELMRLWNQYSTQSMRALCKTLDIDVEPMTLLCAQLHIDIDEQIIYPWTDRRVQALLAHPECIAIVTKQMTTSKAHLLAYLSDAGFTRQLHVGIVDIGWRGTIQDNLAHVCPHIQIQGFYLGLQAYLNEQPANVGKSAYGPNDNRSPDDTRLLHSVSLLEMLSNSPYGSVTGYTQNSEGQYRPNRLIDAEENVVFEQFTRHFQEGVLAACALWRPYLDQYVVDSQELRLPALRLWEQYVRTPDQALSHAHTALHHNELFGVGGFIKKELPPGYSDLVYGIVSGNRRRKVIRFIKQTHWPAGLWIRKDLSFPRKALLVSLCHIAAMYQRIRISITH